MGLSGGLSTNGQGAFSTVVDRGSVLMPLASSGWAGSSAVTAIGTAFKAMFFRAIVPKSGVLHDIAVWNGTVNGNTNVAVCDTGETTAASYTPLWSSGSVAMSGTGAWQVVGDPALNVQAGQHVMLAVMNDGTTATFGTKTGANNGPMHLLPTNFMPASGGNLPKIVATFTFANLTYAAVTEANMTVTTSPNITIIGRIV